MSDHIIRATAANGTVRAFCAFTRDLAEYARSCHDTSPVVTAALGRLLTAGAMMGSMLKAEGDLLTLQIRGNGPMRGLTVTADASANVKGYPLEAGVMLPPNRFGKLDVAGAVGAGTLTVIRDMGLKDPYVGQVELVSGEIAEDIAYYFTTSEQVPSAVALGVLMDKNNTVRQSGGFIIQALPGADPDILDSLTEKLSTMPSVTSMFEAGITPSDILGDILGDKDLLILDTIPTGFKCGCDRARVEKVLISLGREEIASLAAEGVPAELKCQFCGKAYEFSPDELMHLLQSL
ncbi:MAG: Hsp33 family molecular chaperone HslO [Lachnospiraceae bacterium]|nr:Hsp33 family molecular chaperone HslO [Lachnospiraceae bacterium]